MKLWVPYTWRVQNQQANSHTTAHLNTERPLRSTSGTGQYPSPCPGHFFDPAWSFKWFCISLEGKRSSFPTFSSPAHQQGPQLSYQELGQVKPLAHSWPSSEYTRPLHFLIFTCVLYFCFLTGTEHIMRSILCELAIVSHIFWILVVNFNRIVNFTLLAKRGV